MDAEQGRVSPGCTSEEIEREIQGTRARMDETVSAIQEKLSVRHLADEFVDMLAGGAGAGSRRAMQGIRDNPIPAALVGAAVAWLLIDRARSHRPEGSSGITRGGTGRGAGEAVKETVERVTESVSSAADAVRDGASGMGERVSEAGHRISETVKSGASAAGKYVSGVAGGARDAVKKAGSGVADVYRENPLVIAASTLAVGIAIGLSVPASRLENEMMGQASRTLKRKAKAIGKEAADVGQRIASNAARAAKEGSGQGRDLPERVGSALEAAAQTVVRETKDEIAKHAGVGETGRGPRTPGALGPGEEPRAPRNDHG